MDKLSIIGLESDKDKLLRDLMDQGTVELIDQSDRLQQEDWAAIVQKDGEEDRVSRVESQLSEVQTALDAIERYDTSKKPLFNTRKAVSQSAYDTKLSGREHIRSEVSRILDLHNQWNDLKSEENGIVSDQASLKPWATYELPLDQTGTRYVRTMCGILPIVANVQEMEQKIEAVSEATQVTILSSDMEQLYISVLCMRADEEAIVDVMKSYGFTMASFKDMKGTVKENAERLTRRLAEVQGEEKNLEQKLAEAVSTKEDLQYYYDSLILERDKAKASENFLKTGKAFQMEGWMVADARKDIEKVVEENGCICEITEPAKDEQTPILLKNNSLVTPFEAITSMYALPRSYEIDPTPFFAFFYFVFFGMMFADMGYGAVLAIACFAVLKCFDLEGTSYRLIKTMAFCGISTFLWGALFGGFLGDFVSVVSETFFGHRITITPLWFDPLSDPMKLLVFSCVLGTVHLFVGMGIKAYMQIRDGKLVDAIQEVFAWYSADCRRGVVPVRQQPLHRRSDNRQISGDCWCCDHRGISGGTWQGRRKAVGAVGSVRSDQLSGGYSFVFASAGSGTCFCGYRAGIQQAGLSVRRTSGCAGSDSIPFDCSDRSCAELRNQCAWRVCTCQPTAIC